MLKLKLQYFGHLMRTANSLEKTLMPGKIEGRRRTGWKDEEMVGRHHQLNGHKSEQTREIVKDREGWCAAVHGDTKSQTWRIIYIHTKVFFFFFFSGGSANAVPSWHKLCSRVSHIWGNHRNQHTFSSMDETCPGKTTLWLHHFFIHSSVDEHLGYFQVLAIVNSAAINTVVHVSFQIILFSRCMPRSGIAGSYGNSIFSFFKESLYCCP